MAAGANLGQRPAITTLIADDEELGRSLLRSLVERESELELVGECADGATALQSVEIARPDLLLLDIQMPVLDGIAVAERLARTAYAPRIVFVTAHNDYAIRAFDLNALDYVVKPIEKQRFSQAIARAVQAIRQNELLNLTERILSLRDHLRRKGGPLQPQGSFIVKKGDTLASIAPDDIVWVEAANQYVRIHTSGETYMLSETLSAFSRRLAEDRFVRVHRSALVNGDCIRAVTRQSNGTHVIRLQNGAEVALSRSRAALLPVLLSLARRTSRRA